MENDDTFDKTIDHDVNEAQPAQAGPNWTKRLVIGGVAVAALVGAGAALAQGGGWGHGGPRFGMGGFGEHRLERVMQDIDATDAQEKKIWEIVDGLRGEVRPVMRDFRDSRGELVKLLSAPTVDRAAVEKLRAERIVAIDQASQKLSAALIEAAETLTPEQRSKLAERIEERRGGRW